MNRSDKMANWPIVKLIYYMSIPAVFSMLIQAMYNIVDTVYISKLSEKALFTMGLVSPIQFISLSIAIGISVGCGSLISRRLGEGNKIEASLTATSGLIITIVHIILVAIVGILSSKVFLSLFTSDKEVINMGFDYLSIVLMFNFGMFMEIFFSRLQQSQGNMLIPMITQLVGALTNIILDPIFIFGGFGISAFGIKGAAIATVIGQILSGLLSISISLIGKHEVKILFKDFDFKLKRFIDIYVIGVPIIVMNSISSITMTGMNKVLVRFDDLAVASLNIYFKLQSFVFMPIFGFNQGCLPILSYNYGSKNSKRFNQSILVYSLTTTVIMLSGLYVFLNHTEFLLDFFNPSTKLLKIASSTLKIVAISFPFAGISIVMSTIFQSLGKSFNSMLMSIFRQLIILVPSAYILSGIYGLNGVWISYPFAEIMVLLLFLPICIKVLRKSFNNYEK